MLKVQCTIGLSDYEARDEALQQLIVPLGGEYGLSAGSPLKKTHRQLFSEFYESVTGDKLTALLERRVRPVASEELFSAMLRLQLRQNRLLSLSLSLFLSRYFPLEGPSSTTASFLVSSLTTGM